VPATHRSAVVVLRIRCASYRSLGKHILQLLRQRTLLRPKSSSSSPRAAEEALGVVDVVRVLAVRLSIASEIVQVVRMLLNGVAVAFGHHIGRLEATPAVRVGEFGRKVAGEERWVEGVLTNKGLKIKEAGQRISWVARKSCSSPCSGPE
jgi:hypothetical protein